MEITAIRPARAKGTYVVEIDHNQRYVVGEEFIASAAIKVGDRVCTDRLTNLRVEQERTRARSVCLTYLSVRARSKTEIERRLDKEQISEETKVEVMAWLEQLGYIDDAQFAHDWVSHRSKRMRVGSRRLYSELRDKGIAREVIESALELIDDEDEYVLALEAAKTRTNQLRRIEPIKAKRRLYGYLTRRGFSGHIVRKVTEQILG